MSRPTDTERRRARLARRIDALEKMEQRNLITESLGIMAMGIGLPAAPALHGAWDAGQAATTGRKLASQASRLAPSPAMPLPPRPAPAGGKAPAPAAAVELARAAPRPISGDWLTLSGPTPGPASNGVRLSGQPENRPRAGGGGVGGDAGGGGSATPTGTITPLQLPPPSTPGGASPAMMFLAPAPAAAGANSPAAPGGVGGTPSASPPAAPATGGAIGTADLPGGSGGAPLVSPGGSYATTGNSSPASMGSFPYFSLYTVDNYDGVTLFPGVAEYGTLGGYMDLRAQAKGAAGVTFSWNTTGLGTDATGVAGTSTYDLTFQWTTASHPLATNDSVTLTATDGGGQQESQTYLFSLPIGSAGSGSGGAPGTNWPQSLSPNTVLPAAPTFSTQNAEIDGNSGALDATINLPAYNPNLPGLALTYNSLAANPLPIVVVPHTLNASLAVPSQVSAQLTLGGVVGSTYYYNTSQFTPGDIEQIALQANATTLTTGRDSYTATIADIRGTTTTFTITGTATVLNDSSSTFGDGWTLRGLEKITTATGGVVLDEGGGGDVLWFSGGSSGGYTSPAGDFSTLAGLSGSGGGYSRTMTDGTVYLFNSGGQETSVTDRDGLRTTFAYSSGELTTVTDPYTKVTTFAYNSGGHLATITDPASRVTTFTDTGSNLTGVKLPDSSTWSYGYDGSGRLTQVTDPNTKTTSVAYDASERASTITQPDLTTETTSAYQEQGWTNSGTSGSPAAATLLAEARSSFTDPLAHTTGLHPDWNGQGLTDVATDPDGNVTMLDRTSTGLATVAVDRINRITQFAYDSHGNVKLLTNPDLTTNIYAYNSFAEPTFFTNANGNTTTYTYDTDGDLKVIWDPLNNLTTMTYTADGKLATLKDPNSNVTTYQYDSQDRLTTVINPGLSTELSSYDSKGNIASVIDGRGNATTFSHDTMNRLTGMTDPLTDITTYVYDAAGNELAVQAPLSRTTSYAYDAMDRMTMRTDPLGFVTIVAFDSGGNVKTVTDPLLRVTSYAYDDENRRTGVTDPLGNRTTTAYDAAGQVLSVTDPMGRLTTYAYNVRGWEVNKTDPLGHLTTYSYTNTGHLSALLNPGASGGSANAYTYDTDDRLIAVTDANNHTTSYGYDSGGNRITIDNANNHTTTYAYDSRNRVTTVTDPLSHVTVYGYDVDNDQVTATDPLSHTTTTQYDALDRATTVIDSRSGNTVKVFDAAGRNTVEVDPVGNRTTFAYDADDRLTKMTDPLGNAATYVYDNDGELTDQTDRDGRRTTFSYDSGGRQTGSTWVAASPSETITYSYDKDDELTGVKDANATLTFTYDSGGRQLSAATSGTAGQPSVTLTSGYDPYGNRTSLADNLSSVGLATYVYDAAFRLTTITTSYGGTNGPQVILGYDPDNNLTSESRTIGGSGTAVATSLVYDNAERVGTITDQITGGSALATYVYGYDNANLVTSETNAEGTVTYAYDNNNELTGASGSRAETYAYDLAGNRNTTGYTTGTGNELTASPGATYSYDKEGNLIAQTNTSTHVVTSYTYDYDNRLTGVKVGGTVVASYVYDALGDRIGINDNGTQTWTVYDGKNPYADFNGSGTLTERYLYGPAIDEILARTSSGGTTAWYLTDRQLSVRDIVGTAGNELDHIIYDSFGEVSSESNVSNGDRFKFSSGEYDQLTGNYYFRMRYYNPSTGRFVVQDPTFFQGEDSNLYRYVKNQPENATDPNGTSILGDIVSGVQQYANDYGYYYNQNVQSVYNWVYTGELDPTSDVYEAALSAAGYSYANNSPYAHAALSLLGMVPCAGKLATLTNSALYDLEQNGSVSLGTILSILSYVWNEGECFAAGTPLLTPNGEQAIETFRPGDWVLAASEHDPDGPVIARQVEAVFQTRAAVAALKIGGHTILSTAKHPFWVKGKGWTAVADLIEGDQFRSHDGRWVTLSGIRMTGEMMNVYNVRVASDHTYFVGTENWGFSIWAHNDCKVDTSQRGGMPLMPGENAPTAWDPVSQIIYIGANNQGHSDLLSNVGLLPIDPGQTGTGAIFGDPGGGGATYLNGCSGFAGFVGIPPELTSEAQGALEGWLGYPVNWQNMGPFGPGS